jgi:low density lipoprotein-related protein 2
MDEGGYGVPSKVGKVNMNGSNPIILVDDIERPEAITIDLNTKLLYFSAQYPSFVSSLLQFYAFLAQFVVLWLLYMK